MRDEMLRYKYSLEILKKDDQHEHLGTFAIQPDFDSALEWAQFSAMRRNPGPPYVLGAESGAIEPRWHSRAGAPYLEGVQAIVQRDGHPPTAFDIPLAYFTDVACAASSVLVKSGKLATGELFEFLVCAYACPDQPAVPSSEPSAVFGIKPVQQVLDVSDLDMDDLLAESSACGSPSDDEMLVFVPRDVVEEAVALMVRARDKETGGILIGRPHRDPVRHELFLHVTAQIPAQYAEQELSRLTFTPETWTAVDTALALRGKGEILLGWWHSHPASHWCDECPSEKRRHCKTSGALSGDFFSSHDVALHRTVFPRAYSVALVLSDGCGNASAPTWRLYGWRHGMVMARGFRLLEAAEPLAAASVQLEGKTYVPS